MSLSRSLAGQIIKDESSLPKIIELLTKYKMLSLLPSVKQAYIQMSAVSNSNDVIMIESPFAITDDSVKRIKRIVGNDMAEHRVTINKDLLAGFRARFKGVLYDGSAERIIKQFVNSQQ